MELALAIVALLGALAPVLVSWWNRRNDPTPAQRADDVSVEVREVEALIAEHDARGNFAAADALRLQLVNRVTSNGDTGGGHSDGQRLPAAPAGGLDDHRTQ